MGIWLSHRAVGTRPGPHRSTAIAVLALALLTFAAFWPVLHNGFILFDDEDYLTRNVVVQRGLSAQGAVLAFTKSYAGNWFPLTWLSHMLDVELFGLDPTGHHLSSLAIHLASSVLLLLLLRGMTGRAGPSFLVAALFAVHPLRVESVAWASERKDVLSALFWMLTTALYLRYAHRPSARRYLAVLLGLGLGLMAKQMLVTLPLVLLLLDFWPLGRLQRRAGEASGRWLPLRRLLLEKVPMLALAALAGVYALTAQSTVGLVHSFHTFPLAGRVANAILAPARYLLMAVWPVDVAFFYPYVQYPLSEPRVVFAGLFLTAVSCTVLILQRRQPWLLTGWLWYLLTLAPVLGLVQVGDQALADRYTYIPLVGVFIAGAWGSASRAQVRAHSSRRLTAAAIATVLALAGLTRQQVTLWHDDTTLFSHALRVTERNWLAAYFIGIARERAGDWDGAMRSLRASIDIKPDFESSRLGLARLLLQQGRDADVLAELRAAVAAIPRSSRMRLILADALRKRGLAAERIEALRAAVAAIPEDHELQITLALALADGGMDDQAIALLRKAIALWPGSAESCNNLAVLLARQGHVDEAVRLLRRALEIDPSYPDARLNLESLTVLPPSPR
jgi:tetratricopeptide (TPR) repeat protein